MLYKGYVIHIGKHSSVHDMECEICGHQERMQVWRDIEPECSNCKKKEVKKINNKPNTSPSDNGKVICSECGVLEDSYENEYPKLCVPCGSYKALKVWEGVIESELKVYNQRTNQNIDFNEFCFDGDAGQLNPDNLTDLPELYKIYESCLSNIEESKQTGVPPEGDQLEIWFPTGDLPF